MRTREERKGKREAVEDEEGTFRVRVKQGGRDSQLRVKQGMSSRETN